MMRQAHLSSCDKVGELIAEFGTRESVYCCCCSVGWADISFIRLKRGSTVEGTGKGLARGNSVKQLVALPLPPRLVRSQPPDSLPLAPPAYVRPPSFIPFRLEMLVVPFQAKELSIAVS